MFRALCCAGCKPASIKPTLPDVRRAAKPIKPNVCDTLPAFSAWLLLAYRLYPRICFQACIRRSIFLQPSRPFAPRPSRCAVCSSSMAKCYVCHRRRPYKRVRATFDVARIAGRGYMYRSSRWGAPRLWAAALSSLPALSGFSPSAGKPCNPFPLRPPPMLVRTR